MFQSRPPPGGFQSRPPPLGGFQSRPPPQLGFQSRPPPLPIHPDDRPIGRPPLPPGLGHPLPPLGQPQGNHHAPGILTGPVPSWEHSTPFKNNDPTNFDQCKCVHSFNCKSPGLKFVSKTQKLNLIINLRPISHEGLPLDTKCTNSEI